MRKSASSSDGRGPAWARAKIAAAGSRCSSSIAISASVAAAQARRPLLDERPHERAVLVERRATRVLVLDEGHRQLGSVIELTQQECERAEREAAERKLELRSANGHASGYGAAGPNPVSQAAV